MSTKDVVSGVVREKVLPVAKELARTAAHAAVYSAVFTKVANWVNKRLRNDKDAK